MANTGGRKINSRGWAVFFNDDCLRPVGSYSLMFMALLAEQGELQIVILLMARISWNVPNLAV